MKSRLWFGILEVFKKIQIFIQRIGQKEFMSMMDLVCNDAACLFFMFDLSRKATLHSVKEWFIQSRKYNRVRELFIY